MRFNDFLYNVWSQNNSTTTTLEPAKDSKDELETKKSDLPQLASPMAGDQNKKNFKSTLYEAMFYQKDNYEADTEDDSDEKHSQRNSSGRRTSSLRTVSQRSNTNHTQSPCCGVRKSLTSPAGKVDLKNTKG